ncbi:hypothetical protein BJ138DRAFT_1167349 [Hygrophoropsis aurantiaca]|uniref:Uncharacterized protein n=1 Tax=Hygrophoropsis aurantiaca TaxID=72124 RepID=A0ACB7ZSA7_9AGAM|nr:hypothetical protein BJ138DRAFT_1167349 [Hygrophoropsis aurantiaca]
MPATNYAFQVRTPINMRGVTRLELPSQRTVVDITPTILREFPSDSDLSSGRPVGAMAKESPGHDQERSLPNNPQGDRARVQTDYELSPRRTHKTRDINLQFSWWESKSNEVIPEPPAVSDHTPEKGNIFMHWVQPLKKCQLWLYDVVDGGEAWKRVNEGHIITGPGGVQLYLVVTEGCQPSLIQLATWEKQYKRRDTPVLEA